ncbi:MAG TPA: Ig-like domain-containing protein [Verrucomicrobiota bacterium]|nr:Ig-like domain-containing protein [Verrucomicrobiota bacterium]
MKPIFLTLRKRTTAFLIATALLGVSACVAQTTFNVGAIGQTSYSIGGQSDPTLTLTRGVTYTFNISASGHPFYIKTVNNSTGTGNQYTTGVIGNGTQNGTLTFAVPMNAPNTLYYHCSEHTGMGGTLNIINPPNTPPTVTITNPVNGTVVVAPANLLIEAMAGDTDGTVTNVQFRVGANLLANATNAPYSAITNNLPAGVYTLSAIASDNNGARATNAVDVICNARPGVTITNFISGAKFAAPADIPIQVNATDSDGTVTNVQFLSGGQMLGEVSVPPFNFTLNNVAAGNYEFSAIAADNYGTLATSAVVSAFVLTNPTIIAITPLPDGEIQLTISGIAGQTYATESSTNVLDWSAFATNVAPSDIFTVTSFVSPEILQNYFRARQDF